MNVELDEVALPPQSEIKIEFTLTSKVNVTNVTAQRQVSRLLLDLVGNLLYGELPSLVAGRRLLWRVPVWIGSPATGPLGIVGFIDVDADTGEVLYTQALLQEIVERSHVLAQSAASEAG